MAIVSKNDRNSFLSKNYRELYELSIGNASREWLEFRCVNELPITYGQSEPGGLLPTSWDNDDVFIYPLWECGICLTALKKDGEKIDFIEVDFEDPEELLVISRSYQGLIAYLMYYIIEDAGGEATIKSDRPEFLEELREFSEKMNFSFLNEVIKLQNDICKELNAIDLLLNYTNSLD